MAQSFPSWPEVAPDLINTAAGRAPADALDDNPFEVLGYEETLNDDAVDARLRDITILQLLQHTAGFDRGVSFDPMFQYSRISQAMNVDSPPKHRAIIEFMLEQPLDFDPGSKYAYSNFGYCVLGRVIEKVTGQTYEQYVQEQVLNPVGVTAMRIGLSLPEDRAENEVLYYDQRSREGTPVHDTARGGTIRLVSADRTYIGPGGEITARSTGNADDAGDIRIEAGDVLAMQGGRIETSAEASFGGNVTIEAASLVELQRSSIITSVALEDGDGGNITIDPAAVVLNQSVIQANALAGNGGNITIVAGQFFQSADSVVEASSALGIDGTIAIRSPDTDITGDLAQLPSEFSDLAALIQDRCSARSSREGSLVLRGRDRVPSAPDAALSGFYTGGATAEAAAARERQRGTDWRGGRLTPNVGTCP